jgi:hypothetical protein
VGELTLACSPSQGTDRLYAIVRPAGFPGRRAPRPGLGQARGPARRAGPQDHLPTGKGQSHVRRIERESSDATAKGTEQCRVESRQVGGAVPLASLIGPASVARGDHA